LHRRRKLRLPVCGCRAAGGRCCLGDARGPDDRARGGLDRHCLVSRRAPRPSFFTEHGLFVIYFTSADKADFKNIFPYKTVRYKKTLKRPPAVASRRHRRGVDLMENLEMKSTGK
jgi:hypothetical protein